MASSFDLATFFRHCQLRLQIHCDITLKELELKNYNYLTDKLKC